MVNVAAPSLNESMKLIVGNYLNAIKPADVYFGTVESVSPLSIKIDQKHILKEQSLILSNMVKDHPVDLTVSFQTENDKFLIKDHTHPYEDTQPNGQPVTKVRIPPRLVRRRRPLPLISATIPPRVSA